jgi:hypothetical protein
MRGFLRSKVAASGLVVLGLGAGTALAQQGVAGRVGQKLDGVGRTLKTGALEIGDAVRKRFEVVQADVHRMGTHNRVYARLHWDKALAGAKVEVHMPKAGVVLLRGTVPDAEAKAHAVALAAETIGVNEVVDELATTVPPARAQPAAPKASF